MKTAASTTGGGDNNNRGKTAFLGGGTADRISMAAAGSSSLRGASNEPAPTVHVVKVQVQVQQQSSQLDSNQSRRSYGTTSASSSSNNHGKAGGGQQHKVSSMTLFASKIEAARGITDCCAAENPTPQIARNAALDYQLNGARARGEFSGPRWVPDPEASECTGCGKQFDLMNRKHHCRYCGKIFCEECSNYRCLLPKDFRLRDPQRVCKKCNDALLPHQRFLLSDIANYMRSNRIDTPNVDWCGSCNYRRLCNMPYSKTLGSEIRKAAYSVSNIMNLVCIKDGALPAGLIANARGLLFITAAKGGSGLGAQFGTGLLIAKLSDGRWSGPVAVGLAGLCWGALFGAQITDHVIVLNSMAAVFALAGSGHVSVGATIDIAVGPIRRSGCVRIGAGNGEYAIAVSISHSRGLFAGISLEGSLIFSRPKVNYNFYGQRYDPMDILTGVVNPPKAAAALYDVLRDVVTIAPGTSHSYLSPYTATVPSNGDYSPQTLAQVNNMTTTRNNGHYSNNSNNNNININISNRIQYTGIYGYDDEDVDILRSNEISETYRTKYKYQPFPSQVVVNNSGWKSYQNDGDESVAKAKRKSEKSDNQALFVISSDEEEEDSNNPLFVKNSHNDRVV
jgi:lipid-binding SYLF domain-containing protein